MQQLLRVKNLIFNNNTKPSAVVLVYLKGNKLQEKCRTISSTTGRCQSTVLQTFYQCFGSEVIDFGSGSSILG